MLSGALTARNHDVRSRWNGSSGYGPRQSENSWLVGFRSPNFAVELGSSGTAGAPSRLTTGVSDGFVTIASRNCRKAFSSKRFSAFMTIQPLLLLICLTLSHLIVTSPKAAVLKRI